MHRLIFLLVSFFFFANCSNENQQPQSVPTTHTEPALEVVKDSNKVKPETKPEINEAVPVNAENKKAPVDKEVKSTKPSVTAQTKKPSSEETPVPVKPVNDREKTGTDPESKPIEATVPSSTNTGPETQPVVEKAQPPKEEITEAPEPVPFSHELLDQLLRKYVSSSGKVNYAGLKSEKARLDQYLQLLENTPLEKSWSRSKKMAFWINAYNAFTLKLIVDNYPVSSITKLEGGKPWDKKWIRIDGKTLSLDNIENDILRPRYKDARIHFAVNCAAKSCPALLNRAWTEKNLNSYLEKQTKVFVNNSKFNKIGRKEVEISRIFEWYAVDFGNLIDFLNKYSDLEISKKAKINYLEYDWSLNQ